MNKRSLQLCWAKVLIESWRNEYNQFKQHSSVNYQTQAPETIIPKVEILT